MNYRHFSKIHGVLALIFLLICFSCNNGNKPIQSKQSMKLVKDVESLQMELPRSIDKGIVLVKAEYVDSVYTLWIDVDDKVFSFEEMMKLGERRKREILSDASVSEGIEREHYEEYVVYNIRMRMILVGENSRKQTEFTITPSEINEALHTKADAYSKLQMLINSSKPKATEKVKGMSDPIITLQDSTVFMTIALDDDMYDVMSLKDHASKDDIMEELKTVNPKLLRLMADAKCGYIYRVIGSRSKKGFDITFSPKEVLNNRQVLDSKFEIVESDE